MKSYSFSGLPRGHTSIDARLLAEGERTSTQISCYRKDVGQTHPSSGITQKDRKTKVHWILDTSYTRVARNA